MNAASAPLNQSPPDGSAHTANKKQTVAQGSRSTPRLLTQNRELKRDGVWNFTLPAWVVELPDGTHFNVCPNAGICAKFCYARNGTYLFPKVRGKHLTNLEAAQSEQFFDLMCAELSHKKFTRKLEPRAVPGLDSTDHLSPWVQRWIAEGGQAVRIHDSGDFFSEDYLRTWIRIAEQNPHILFYAYTKEVALVKSVVLPDNFLICFSLGGRQDHLLDLGTDRHADVFPDEGAIVEAGYMSQHASDLLCVLLPSNKIGIPQNNIRHVQKKLGTNTFGQVEKMTHRASRKIL